MDKIDKKKRHVSGSRSKSKKSKPNDASVDMKPHKVNQAANSHEHSSKVKTENSLNKSKGSKKYTKYSKKTKFLKTTKPNNDESKEISRSASAERKHSLVKMNRTQANFEGEDLQRKIYALKKTIKKIQKPTTANTKEIFNFYREIQDSIEMVSQPLYSLLCCLHQLYLSPMAEILDMISPYEHLLQRKEELSRQVQQQVRHNQQVYSKLSEEDIYIIKLKETIEQQKQLIDEKRKEELRRKSQLANKHNLNQTLYDGVSNGNDGLMFKNQGVIRNMRKDKANLGPQKIQYSIEKEKDKSRQKQMKSTLTFKDNSKEQEAQRDSPAHQFSIGNKKQTKQTTLALKGASLKLDLGGMNRNEAVGFHDQFYSKIDEFSESWRNQALREKRY